MISFSDTGECWRRFQRMLVNILGITWEDSGGMFKKIPGNTQEDWTLYNAIKQKQNQSIICSSIIKNVRKVNQNITWAHVSIIK